MRILLVFAATAVVGLASAQSLYSSVTVNTTTVSGGGTDFRNDSVSISRAQTLGLFTGSATAQSDFGELHAAASASNAGGGGFSYAQALSRFGDLITITGGVGTGTYLIDFTADGTFSSSGTANVRTNLLWDNLPNGVTGGLMNGSHVYEGLFAKSFTYGVPFSIYGELLTVVEFNSGGVGEGMADFEHTARLSAIHVFDSKGAAVAATVTSASGHAYPQPVPEPASMAALGLGLAFLRRRPRA